MALTRKRKRTSMNITGAGPAARFEKWRLRKRAVTCGDSRWSHQWEAGNWTVRGHSSPESAMAMGHGHSGHSGHTESSLLHQCRKCTEISHCAVRTMRTHRGSHDRGLMGKCMRISWPCGECVSCDRLVGNRIRNNAKSKRFRLF